MLDLLTNRPIEIGHFVGFPDLTDLHNDWLRRFLYSKHDLTLQAHRGSYKTTTLSLFFAIHCITRPNETVQYFRKTDTDVEEISRQTINILRSGCMQMIVKRLYGVELELTKATNNEISTNLCTSTKGASQIVGLGIGTSITGKHADIVVTDDIINVKDRISQAERDRTKIFYQELVNVKNRGGRFINTGTPWHKDDAFTLMPAPQKWDCYQTGLISPEKLEELRRQMAPSLFAANYELKHIAAEGALFSTYPTYTEDPELLRDGIAHIDAAYGGEDSTAFTCCHKGKDGKMYMYGRLWHSHFDKHVDECIQIARNLRCAPVHVEDADKGFVAREFERRGMQTSPYHERENKIVKISTYLRKWWPDIVWLKGTDPEYIDQIMDYTECAAHDDAPDSAACCIRVYDKFGTVGAMPKVSGQRDSYWRR